MSELVLSQQSKKLIAQAIKELPQAIIISGPRGIGVMAAAKYIRTAVGSAEFIITPKKRMANGTKFVEDSENGLIIIEDIRELYEHTRSKFQSPQVFIFDFANRTMTTQAQNAFLKLLEEPQQNVHFILATHHPESLLPTVLSRSQRINLTPVTVAQTRAQLDALNVADATMRARIEFIAAGLPAETHRLATDPAYYDERVATVQDARAVLEGSPYDRLKIIRSYKDQRIKSLQLIDDLIRQLSLALKRAPQPTIIKQIDTLISAYDKIQANGNVQLQLLRVLL